MKRARGFYNLSVTAPPPKTLKPSPSLSLGVPLPKHSLSSTSLPISGSLFLEFSRRNGQEHEAPFRAMVIVTTATTTAVVDCPKKNYPDEATSHHRPR